MKFAAFYLPCGHTEIDERERIEYSTLSLFGGTMAPDNKVKLQTWYGLLVHHPSHGELEVTFAETNGTVTGTWNFPKITRGAARKGTFVASSFANFLNVRITSKPLKGVQCQLAILGSGSGAMMTGLLPLDGEKVPFATVTLFRNRLGDVMAGICPFIFKRL
jgi:hypothetical protein